MQWTNEHQRSKCLNEDQLCRVLFCFRLVSPLKISCVRSKNSKACFRVVKLIWQQSFSCFTCFALCCGASSRYISAWALTASGPRENSLPECKRLIVNPFRTSSVLNEAYPSIDFLLYWPKGVKSKEKFLAISSSSFVSFHFCLSTIWICSPNIDRVGRICLVRDTYCTCFSEVQ